MPRRRLRSSRLPVELYRPIVQNIVDQGDLSALCATSRILRYEAELVLYGHVHLSGDYSQLLSWALVIARTPRVARLVHALTLPVLCTFRYPLREGIAKALKALINLKELYLVQPPVRVVVYPYLETYMLDGCTFCLTKFHAELRGTDLSEYSNFFERQQGIRYLMTQGEDIVIGPHQLPHLTQVRLESSKALKYLAPRPLRCIRLDRVQMTDATIAEVVSSLVLFKATLNRLSIEITEPSEIIYNDYLLSMSAMICLIAKKVHKIEFLCVSHDVVPHLQSDNDLNKFTESLSTMKDIETIMIDTAEGSNSFDRSYLDDRLRSQELCLEVAGLFMTACPSLLRVTFPAQGMWVRGRCPCYIRKQGGGVELEGFDIIDKESWLEI